MNDQPQPLESGSSGGRALALLGTVIVVAATVLFLRVTDKARETVQTFADTIACLLVLLTLVVQMRQFRRQMQAQQRQFEQQARTQAVQFQKQLDTQQHNFAEQMRQARVVGDAERFRGLFFSSLSLFRSYVHDLVEGGACGQGVVNAWLEALADAKRVHSSTSRPGADPIAEVQREYPSSFEGYCYQLTGLLELVAKATHAAEPREAYLRLVVSQLSHEECRIFHEYARRLPALRAEHGDFLALLELRLFPPSAPAVAQASVTPPLPAAP